MSVIDHVLLMCSKVDREIVKTLALEAEDIYDDLPPPRPLGFGIVDDAVAGGDKVFCKLVALACVNGLHDDDVRRRFERAPWREPESVILLIQKEEEIRPSVWGFEGAFSFGSLSSPFNTKPLKLVQLAAAVPS